MTAKSLSKADIKNLEKLRESATDFSELKQTMAPVVMIEAQYDDASFIKDQVDIMDR